MKELTVKKFKYIVNRCYGLVSNNGYYFEITEAEGGNGYMFFNLQEEDIFVNIYFDKIISVNCNCCGYIVVRYYDNDNNIKEFTFTPLKEYIIR